MMHEHGKPDGPVVPSKPPNKADGGRFDRVHPNRSATERVEGRGPAKENPHEGDALDALYTGLLARKVNWVLEADIRGFFDAIDREWLMKFVEHRIGDWRVSRLIRKWLSAGVLEDGVRTHSQTGTVQGGSISPLLANTYLHYAFDLWVQQWRTRQARGDVNGHALMRCRLQVGGLWHRALCRRSQHGRIPRQQMRRLIALHLPMARICHPYPLRRLGVVT